MYIANIRTTFQEAPHDVLSQMTQTESDLGEMYLKFLAQGNIEEVVILQTCNRFEVFYSGKGEEKGVEQARKVMLDRFGAPIAKHMKSDQWVETIDHLFRVTSSLDSMIVGENQIMAQVKDAFAYSSKEKHCGRVLTILFQKALSVGKRVRTETEISRGKVSISSAAVDLADQKNDLAEKKIIIVGSGKMASYLADNLCEYDLSNLTVVGRTQKRLETYCEKYGGKPVYMENIVDELADADFLFSATSSPRVLVTREMVERAMTGREKPLTILDIAMPEDIDPTVAEVSNVSYFCLDDLKEISEKNKELRESEAENACEIINEELGQFMGGIQNFHIQNLLSHLNLYTEEIRERELRKSLSMLEDPDPNVRSVMDGLTKSLVRKVMHNFILALKDYPGDSEEIKNFVNIFLGNHNFKLDSDVVSKGSGHPSGIPMNTNKNAVRHHVSESENEKA
jgi:glutamyl-tRNA reductase